MDDWRRAVSNYQQGVQSVAQANIAQNETIQQSKASLISGQTASAEVMAQGKFADRLTEESKKFAGELGLDVGLGATAPTLLRGAAGLARMRASALNSKWKTTQAKRFREQEAGGEDVGPSQMSDMGPANDSDIIQSARQGGADPLVDPASSIEFDEPKFTDAFTSDYTARLNAYPPALQNATPQSSAMRRAVDASPEEEMGYSGSATSQRIGDLINEREQQGAQARGEVDVDDAPLQKPVTQGQSVTTKETGEVETQDKSIAQQQAEADTQATTRETDAIGEDVEDLAPEITEASSAWSSVAGFLGDAIPAIGFGLGIYGIVSGAESIAKSVKEASADPYASVRGQIAQAQTKIGGLEADVGADEFASKIGARAPQFGSIAASPNLDTAKMQNVALHV